jgi:hypothetical protein
VTVAALYVDPRGAYTSMRDVDCWPLERDARRYEGPFPVVAHPPCGPWSKMRHLCTKQDPTCGPAAVRSVQHFGGVLEHPAYSKLFWHCRLPLPGEFADAHGGRTFAVQQVSWGHCCNKATWLYIVGVPDELVWLGMRSGGVATHRVTSGPRGPRLPSADKRIAALTPPEFARWLIDLARNASASDVFLASSEPAHGGI